MPTSIFRRLTKRFFIIANLLVATMFLIGCYSELFFSASWWPVGLLTISLLYLLIILLLFFIFWLFVKPVYTLIFVITAALSFNHVRNIIPFRFSSLFIMQKQVKDLRVMSWNVAQFDIMKFKEQPGTYYEMISLVNEFRPDIACFQEMVSGDTLADLNTPYYRKYSFYSVFDFVDKLKLPHYFYSYNYKENFLSQQHFGIIIFSKYPIINRQTISNFPNDYNSIFQYADIVKGDDTIRVFNCHLQSLRFSATNLKYLQNPSIKTDTDIEKSKNLLTKFRKGFLKRQVQADRIRAEINKSPHPVIICGDFNDVPNSYPYETIGNGLQDAFVKKGAGMGRTFSGISPTLRIDNIFVDKRYSVNQFIRIPKKLSDHFPIITDISRLPE
ncbi:MAG: endonuclease/exonuclease/phosphatase family protein [Ferruginibacter sp.]|nr:endonuclease/exonuclease/phosphatase family protein [Ferruginibacter sp.]